MPAMKPAAAPLLLVPFKEIRHDAPDDCLHYEPVGVRGALHDWTIPAHRHEALHQFQLLEAGGAVATIDGAQYRIEAPCVLMLAPDSVHGFAYTPGTRGHQITIPTVTLKGALRGADQVEALLASSFVLNADALPTDEAKRCAQLFDALAAEFQAAHPGRVHALLAQATLIALWFLRHRGAQPAEAPHRAVRDTLVQRLRALVEANFREHRPLAFYAEALNVTPDHLSRSCRTVTGQSALDLVHARLMLEARRLLAYTPMNVNEIAASLGYDDPAYFSKFFARTVGESPTAYRDSVAKGVRQMEREAP